MKRGGWISFVQVHLLTNLSDPFPKEIVRERLPMGSAFYEEKLLDIVFGDVGWSAFLGIFFAFAFILHFERITGLWNFVL